MFHITSVHIFQLISQEFHKENRTNNWTDTVQDQLFRRTRITNMIKYGRNGKYYFNNKLFLFGLLIIVIVYKKNRP